MDAEELLFKYESGIRDFTSILLCEANLSRVNLSQADFSQAILSITNLSGANLTEVNLQNAKLNVARLSGANLSKANLSSAILNVANLIRADLSEANLVNSSLIRAELMRSDLSGANLSGANLSEADLREATLRQANLEQVNLNGANLRDVVLIASNLERASLHRADLYRADLRGVNLSNSELRQVNLSKSNLSGANLRGANLRWADLNGANLRGANLEQARLSGASLCGADLSEANLMNAVFVHADLTQANLIGADWTGADLTGAALTGAKLHGVPRYGLKAEEVTCDWVDLSVQGDGSKIRCFSSKEANKFFNSICPTVEISVDTTLNFEANFYLAETYRKIAQQYPSLAYPPSLEYSSRRTILSFKLDTDEQLFLLAYVAILPFKDGYLTQDAIKTGLKMLTPDNCSQMSVQLSNRIVQLGAEMTQQIHQLEDVHLPYRNFPSSGTAKDFFQFPTRTLLKSSSHQTLIIYSNPCFGRSLGNLPELVDGSKNIKNSYLYLNTLEPETLISFIKTF